MSQATPGGALVMAPPAHWTVGDRMAAFRALLPARAEGPVVLLVGAELSPHLQAAWPDAVVLARPDADAPWPQPRRVVRWDGRRPPLASGRAALVVVDTDEYDEDAARALLADGGVLASLGRRGTHLLYPSSSHPELLWRRGWPVPAPAGVLAGVRRRLGLAGAWVRGVPRLHVDPGPPSLADAVMADLARATGEQGELVGVLAAGRTVLRVRTAAGDLAVRLSLTGLERDPDPAAAVAHDVPEAVDLLPVRVARGETLGHPWVATRWTPRPRRPLAWVRDWLLAGLLTWPPAWPWLARGRRWDVARGLARMLAARPTGHTGPGWSRRWVDTAELLPLAVRDQWARRLEVLDAGVPTGWCHGDLWSGNVLLDRDTGTVVDWDNASPDAPQGLDQLLIHAMERATGERAVTAALVATAREPALDVVVAGRRWAEHAPEVRGALALAAVVLYLRNRSLADAGGLVDDLAGDLDGGQLDDRAGEGADERDAGRTARGALWLATNGLVVKASQTVVLLTLAAVLAPASLGLVALGSLIANVSAVVASLGTASALVYWRGDVARAARTAVTIGVATGGALAAVLWIAAPVLARALNAGDGGVPVIRGLTITLPCLAVAAVTNELLRRRLAFARRILPDSVSALVGAGVAITLAVQGHGVMALVAGQVVQASLTMLLAWVVHPPVLPGWNGEDARGLLSYGGPYAAASLLELVQLNVDYLIVSWVLGAAALGQYSLAFRIAFMPYLMVVVVVAGAAFPFLCRQRGPALGRAVATVMGATLSLVAPICLGVALVAGHLVLLGEQWRPGVPVVAWLALYAVLLSVGQLVQTAFNASGRPGLSLLLRLSHLLLLTTVLLVAAHWGVTAVAVGQVLAVSVIALTALTLARRRVAGFSVAALAATLRPVVAAAAVMAAVILGARRVVDPHAPTVTGLVLLAVLGAAAYAVTLWALDRQRLREAARLLRTAS